MNVTFVSVVPSPYQRDLFKAIHSVDEIELSVYYLESAAPDSPWPAAELRDWEKVLPGWCAGKGRVRSHCNWQLPDLPYEDVVVVNTALTDITTQRLLRRGARSAKRSSGAKWLFWGELMRSSGGLAGALRNQLSKPLAKVNGIVAIGSVAAREYQSRFPDQTVYQLPYYCDIQPFIDADKDRSKTAKNDGALNFLFCGQMIYRKGVDLLLGSFDRICNSGINATLTLVGREAELPNWLEGLGRSTKERIDVVGFKAVEELPKIFAQADVFVLPSRHDGWGVVVNQAVAAGLPVISTNRVGAAADLLQHETNGLIVDAGDGQQLEKAMRRLAENQKLREQMKTKNRLDRSSLLPQSGATGWVEIFERVLANGAIVQ